ncbi:MAG: metallophosphoesterase [Bacteroidota bacterium]
MSHSRLMYVLLFVAVLALIDWYVFQAVRQWSQAVPSTFRKSMVMAAATLTVGSLISILLLFLTSASQTTLLRNFLFVIILTNVLSKLLMAIFLFMADLVRLGKWGISQFSGTKPQTTPAIASEVMEQAPTISRSDFLVKAALVAGAIPVVGVTYGILSGAHDYRVRRVKLALKNLPKSFHGLRIAQLSDIHSGSFFNKTAVKGGVEMLLREKPDVIFFTGDLVNNEASEVKDYIDIFNKIKAPLGVYSILGNHDYGDYKNWGSTQAKHQNLEDLKKAHQRLGWDLLLDEHRTLKQGNDEIAIIGNQNWGTKFAKYGSLDKAYQGTQDFPVKLLLSHDPTHWDAQVRPNFPDIDVMFAGHTHGAQFGVEVGDFRWSPVKYVYKQWADLHQEKTPQGKVQYLYVNRGFGYIGFPGRVGILPEITIFELESAS